MPKFLFIYFFPFFSLPKSYGGYLSAMTLFNENSPFRCAVSGAPVVDWLLYDSAYTERYMGPYSENRQGYEVALRFHFISLFASLIQNFNSKPFFFFTNKRNPI
jgi:hypothetical protein